MQNLRNLVFSKVVWHAKMLFGMYVVVCHVLACFTWQKKMLLGIF